MSIKVLFSVHSTSLDNENNISSGIFDAELSKLGIKQAKELIKYFKDIFINTIYCSDLQRSYKTAVLAFESENVKIIKDKRLRECDYGDYTQYPSNIVFTEKANRINIPFPNGESYIDCVKRTKAFLNDVIKINKDGDTILIIGHSATDYCLKHIILKEPLLKCITDPWEWKPFWEYKL